MITARRILTIPNFGKCCANTGTKERSTAMPDSALNGAGKSREKTATTIDIRAKFFFVNEVAFIRRFFIIISFL
jgi:hypothetical protein